MDVLFELSKSVKVFHDLDPVFKVKRITYFSFNMKIDVFIKTVVRVKFSTDFHRYVI